MVSAYFIEKPDVSHVVIDSIVIVECEVPATIGRRFFTVDIVEQDCEPITTYTGTDYAAALKEAGSFRLPVVNLASVIMDAREAA